VEYSSFENVGPVVFIDYDTDDCVGEKVDGQPLVYREGNTLFKRGFYIVSGGPAEAPFVFEDGREIRVAMYVHPSGTFAFGFDGKMFPYDRANYELVRTEWERRLANSATYVPKILSLLTDNGKAWEKRPLGGADKRLVLDMLFVKRGEECTKRTH
jgi:hypothetical protein